MPGLGISLGLGIGPRSGGGGGTPPPSVSLAMGDTYGYVGDGIPSEGAASGICVPHLAVSGTSISNPANAGSAHAWINPTAINALGAQKPDVFMFLSCGANENLLGQSSTSSPQMLDWIAACQAGYAKAKAVGSKIYLAETTWPSAKTGEATYREANWVRQREVIDALSEPGGPVIVRVDTNTVDPAVHNILDAGNRVHPNQEGGLFGTLLIVTALAPYYTHPGKQAILDAIFGLTYPKLSTQNGTDRALTGTGGTVTAPVTGSAPTGKAVSTGTGAAVASEVIATTGGRQAWRSNMDGTATGAGNIRKRDSANLSIPAATRGANVLSGAWLRIPAGMWSIGTDTGSFGSNGTNQAGANSAVTAGTSTAIDSVVFTRPFPIKGAANYNTQRSWAVRPVNAAGAMPGTDFDLEQPFIGILSDVNRMPPEYIGDLQHGGGAFVMDVKYRAAPTGTFSATTGGTLTAEIGQMNVYGIQESHVTERTFWRGTAADTAVDSGTQIGVNMTGSTWSQTIAGSGSAGQLVYVQYTVTTPAGTTRFRAKTTITVGS
jgi:hypothetical protein